MREKNPHGRLPVVATGLLALILTACTPEKGEPTPHTGKAADKTDTVAEQAAPPPTAKPAHAREVEEKTDDYTFRFSYPAAAAQIPALKAELDTELEKSRGDLINDTAQFRKEAAQEGFPFRPYDQVTEWAVVTDLPDWLSLSTEVYAYTGGAHGNTGYGGLLWDKKANVRREALSLFSSAPALEKAVQPALCDALDRERSKRREEKVVRNQDDWMTACIGLKETQVILGSAGRKAFDRIGFLIGPYAAGPYAEGSYEITLPVTPAILATVKPEYKGSFAIGR